MAKALPYFKFYCSEWSDGDITLEDMKTQGVFINICSYYWSQECNISFDKLQKRFKIYKKQIENLKKAKIIFSENDNLVIKFLDKQWLEREAVKHRNQQNGKAGGRPKITQSVKSGLAEQNPNETNIEENKEEKNKEDIKTSKKDFIVPSWIQKDSWDGFVEMRNKIKKPLTLRAKNMIVAKLEKFGESNANECLEQSTLKCWQDVFEVKKDYPFNLETMSFEKDMQGYATAGKTFFVDKMKGKVFISDGSESVDFYWCNDDGFYPKAWS